MDSLPASNVPWIDLVMVAVVLANFAILGSSRLSGYIRLVAIQGVLLALLPVLAGDADHLWRDVALMIFTMGIKGIMFPILLGRTVESIHANREAGPYISYPLSMAAGVAGFLMALWIADSIAPSAGTSGEGFLLPVALSTVFVGLFVAMSRRKAISQVIGFLVFENGIWMFGVALVKQISVLLELAILLDVFVAVFVLGIAIHRISREFEHIDMDKLDTLKG